MYPGSIGTKGQGDTFKERAPGRWSHESGQTLGEEGTAEPIKEETVVRIPVKRCREKVTTSSHWWIRSPRGDLGSSMVDLGLSSVDLVPKDSAAADQSHKDPEHKGRID